MNPDLDDPDRLANFSWSGAKNVAYEAGESLPNSPYILSYYIKKSELNTLAALKLVVLCHLGPQTLKIEIRPLNLLNDSL